MVRWDDEKTLQYEGIANELMEPELSKFKRIYVESRPNIGIQAVWPGLTYFRVRPKWVRFSNYNSPWTVEELTFK